MYHGLTITAILAAAVPDMPTINKSFDRQLAVPVAAEGITTVAAMSPPAGPVAIIVVTVIAALVLWQCNL